MPRLSYHSKFQTILLLALVNASNILGKGIRQMNELTEISEIYKIYEELTKEARENIALRKEIRKFRKDSRASEHTHIRASLSMTNLCYKMSTKRLLEDRRLIRQGKPIKEKIVAIWHQFDTCSYKELTFCVKGRIRWIRESINFLNNPKLVEEYKIITERVRKGMENDKCEISKILKMRRVLKKSGQRNWNSDRLTI